MANAVARAAMKTEAEILADEERGRRFLVEEDRQAKFWTAEEKAEREAEETVQQAAAMKTQQAAGKVAEMAFDEVFGRRQGCTPRRDWRSPGPGGRPCWRPGGMPGIRRLRA